MESPASYSNEPAISSNGNYLHGASAAVLGWTLEAYEYFVLVFIVDALARDFHVFKEAVIRTFIASLAMRPSRSTIIWSVGGSIGPDEARCRYWEHISSSSRY